VNSHDVAELAQTLFEEIGDMAVIVDPATMRLFDVNPMAQRLTCGETVHAAGIAHESAGGSRRVSEP
jgi:hypothetical protein